MAQSPLHTETVPPAGDSLPEPGVGDRLGPYRLDSLAGEGGMGRVFCATHTKLDKRVALKVLRRKYSRRAEAIARFFQEARAVNLMRHPNIVEITDFVEGTEGGQSYYIMEWLDGMTLAERLRRDRTLAVDLVVHIGRQMASALAEVHKAGFVHRDLKPDNIFLVQSGEGETARCDAKILDFGVAMLQGPTDGAVAGTPAYFSPEGAAGRALDGRSDIYSLGVMLYELLAGAPPFSASSMSEYVLKHMTAQPRSLHEVVSQPLPRALVSIIDRCLAKSPGDRFQSMEEVEQALASLVGEGPAQPEERHMPWGRIAVAALLVLLGSATLTRAFRRPAAPAPREMAVTDERQPPSRPAAPVEAAPAPAPPTASSPTADPSTAAAPPAAAPTLVAPAAPDPTTRAATPEAPAAPAAAAAAPATAAPATPATDDDGSHLSMRVTSDPPGVEVSHDGVLLGVTPCRVRLEPGSRELTFHRVGFRDHKDTFVVRDGGTISVSLTPLRSRPAAASPTHGSTINPFD